MTEDQSVSKLLSPENHAWISSLLLPEFLPEATTNPSLYLLSLFRHLFSPQNLTEIDATTDRDRLRIVREIVRLSAIPGDFHYSAILSLTKPKTDSPEGREQFNNLLSAVRDYLTPTQELRDHLILNLNERQTRCLEQFEQMTKLAEENERLTSKIERIEKLMNAAPDGKEKTMAIEILKARAAISRVPVPMSPRGQLPTPQRGERGLVRSATASQVPRSSTLKPGARPILNDP
jgi:hypothetical protein